MTDRSKEESMNEKQLDILERGFMAIHKEKGHTVMIISSKSVMSIDNVLTDCVIFKIITPRPYFEYCVMESNQFMNEYRIL